MFEAKVEKASFFKKIVDAVKDLIEVANVECGDTGLSMQAMDSSHVSLVFLSISKKGFSFYRCDRARQMGINFGSLARILKCAANDDEFTLKHQIDDATVSCLLESKVADKVSEFAMNLLEIDEERLGIPDKEYDCKVTIPSIEFQRICRDLSKFSDTVSVKCSKDGIKFSAAGDNGTCNIVLGQSSCVDKSEASVVIDSKKTVELNLALSFLTTFTKATPLSTSVVLHLHHDMPLVVEYALEDCGHIKYYLAPKIEDDAER
ncbi:proliferating cell nuclear antigen-like [Zophobas morio]|jgi:proliferating cell nuclear antigen|uniref:proliferating cell nuclear antigen-like n=1 Tax=Zophobas morio TaxID=2755281 RepID=UPI0030831C2A